MLYKIARLFAWLLFPAFIACNGSEEFTPKPKGYNRIDLPGHEYQSLEENHPYWFEYSKNAIIQPDTFGQAEPHWIIVYYPELDARIQLTYKPLNGDLTKLSRHVDDAYKLAGKHHVKADSQEEMLVPQRHLDIAADVLEQREAQLHDPRRECVVRRLEFAGCDHLRAALRGIA